MDKTMISNVHTRVFTLHVDMYRLLGRTDHIASSAGVLRLVRRLNVKDE